MIPAHAPPPSFACKELPLITLTACSYSSTAWNRHPGCRSDDRYRIAAAADAATVAMVPFTLDPQPPLP